MESPLQVRRVAVLGASGSIGRHLVPELRRVGVAVRAVSRSLDRLQASLGAPVGGSLEHIACDLHDPDATTRAVAGCDVVVHAIGLPISEFGEHPKLARSTVGALRRTGARALLVSSYWPYDPILRTPVPETALRSPIGLKCRLRKDLEEVFAGAGAAVAVLPDFFGPAASASLLNDLIYAIASRRSARWPARPDAERDFLFLPDAARLLAALALRREAYGQRWNIPGSGVTTPDRIAGLVGELTQQPVRLTVPPLWLVQLTGIVRPRAKELIELINVYSRPAVLDGRKLRALLGDWKATDYPAALRATLEWMGARPPRRGA